MTRVALLTPNWRWDTSPLPVDTLTPPCSPPLEWAYLATGLRESYVGLVDAYGADLTLTETVRLLEQMEPDTIVVSTAPSLLYWRCPPFTIAATRGVVDALRTEGYPGMMIVVGPHGTHSPDWTLRGSGADAVWRGSTDVALGPALRSGEISMHHSFVNRAEKSSVIAVDTAEILPVADYSVFDRDLSYAPHMWLVDDEERERARIASRGALAEASRGCPWACAYCAKGPVRDSYGRRPLALLLTDIRRAKSAGFDYLFFVDETFNIPSEHFDQVLSALRSSDMTFGFQGRPDLIDPPMARQLADAGCVYVELGIDIVDGRISHDLGRRQKLEKADRGVAACRDHLPIVRFNRLNSSTLDYDELYSSETATDWDVPADPIYPYPGAPLGRDLMRKYGRNSFDWEFAEQYSWWLRIEIYLQRNQSTITFDAKRELQQAFLGLTAETARQLADLLGGIERDPEFHERNKAVLGDGGRPHYRHTRSQ